MNNLFLYAEKLASGLDSKYSGIRYDKARLVEFLEANEWFEITPTIRDKAPCITTEECEAIGGRLELWLSAFK